MINALKDRLAREEQKDVDVDDKVADAMEIGRYYVAQPLLDDRTNEQIIGNRVGIVAAIVDTSALLAILEQKSEARRSLASEVREPCCALRHELQIDGTSRLPERATSIRESAHSRGRM